MHGESSSNIYQKKFQRSTTVVSQYQFIHVPVHASKKNPHLACILYIKYGT